MQATAIALAIALAATAQQAPVKKYAEGQEVRICGEVKTQRTAPPACDTTMRVASAGEEFDVRIPASVVKELGVAPQRMRGAEVCFSGRIAMASGVPGLNVASRSGVPSKRRRRELRAGHHDAGHERPCDLAALSAAQKHQMVNPE